MSDPAFAEPHLLRPADACERRHVNFFEKDEALVQPDSGDSGRANEEFQGWRNLAFRTPEQFGASGPGSIIGFIRRTLAVASPHGMLG